MTCEMIMQRKTSNDLKYLVVDKTASPKKTYDDFLNDLPPNDIRIALLDIGAKHVYPKHTLYFIYWVPDTVPIRLKMFLASVLYSIKCVFSASLSNVSLQAEISDFEK